MKPRPFNERTIIRDIIESAKEYLSRCDDQEPKHIVERFQKTILIDPETSTAQDFAGLNYIFTERCDGCDKLVTCGATVGQEPDYESSTATLCIPCLQEAIDAATRIDD